MPIRNLDKLFKPRRIAIVGASIKPESLGYIVVRNLISAGFEGTLYPVHPAYESVCGIPAYRTVGEIPREVDLAIICTPARTLPQVVRECGEKGIRGLIVLTAGFREIGPEGRRLEDELVAAVRSFDGMRMVGPNCLGILAPHAKMNASFAAGMPPAGSVAFASQSGALCTSALDWAREVNVGFSHFVSVGNMLDVGMADLIDFFSLDPHTEAIVLYIESLTDAREFMSAARAFTRKRPIVAYKAGRFAESAQAAASHTGALAGVDAVYEAAFARAGIVRVLDVDDMFACAELLARHNTLVGPRLAIVTNAGGPGVMATDELMSRKGVLATLDEATIAELNQVLPAAWSHRNPVDILGDAPPDRFVQAVKTVLADKNVDAALVILTPQAMTDPTSTAQQLLAAVNHTRKPLLAAWMGGLAVRPGREILERAGVPAYSTPEQAVRAFMYLVEYSRRREVLYETPRDVPIVFPHDRESVREQLTPLLRAPTATLSEEASKKILAAYDIPVAMPVTAHSPDEAAAAAEKVGLPVVLKILSSQISHKTDVGGVVLNLSTADAVREAYQRIVATAKEKRPDAHIEGCVVERMVAIPSAHELIVGAKRDAVFGPVLLVGAGGVAAEVLGDHALELPPLNARLALRMLQSLRSWPLLQGYRGRPGVDLDRLLGILIRVSYLVADLPEVSELDINPLLISANDAIALDARIVVDQELVGKPVRPFSHLTIRPVPTEWTRRFKLPDGTPVVLRPIRPEDEPLWHEMAAACSLETIERRFRYVFRGTTHEMGARFCFIDYDRELAMVAEVEEEGRKKLVGIGRLVADADHRDAEFAVLAVDAWQGRGLGSAITDCCLEICQHWGVRSITAHTAPDNSRMIGVFRRRGFEFLTSPGVDPVVVRKRFG